MKKFTKGCLITALVLFIFGWAFWGISGIMGGFAQLESRGLRKQNFLSIGWDGFRIGYDGFGLLNWNWDWEDSDDWEATEGVVNLAENGELVQTQYSASDITGIDVELGGRNLVIAESEDDFIWLRNDSSAKTVKYGVKNGIFKLQYGEKVHFWNNVYDVSKNGTIYLYLPKNMQSLNSIDIELGAGNLESISLTANEIDIDAGAGDFTLQGLSGKDIDIVIGAGTAEIDKITCDSLSMEAGAGGIVVQELAVTNLDMETGAGSIELTGSITGKADIECAAGSVDITLDAAENDYDYQLECSVGSIEVGSNEYSGLASEKYINNNAGRKMDIECAAGSVEVRFNE